MISFPKCLTCKHYIPVKKRGDDNTCLAFPGKIPLEILNENVIHDKIVEGQAGSYIYTRKED